MLRSVIIGANQGRARGHAAAYAMVTGAILAAVSARTPGVAKAFAGTYGVPFAFEDYHRMLAEVRPDIVHINTPPTVRLSVLEDCEAAGVRGVILEKPLGVDGADYDSLAEFADRTSMRVVVNHQLHFHPRRQELMRLVREGSIGSPTLIDASAGDTIAYQGTHTLQALCAFSGSRVTRVFAQVSGDGGLAPNPAQHYAPDNCAATLDLESGATALFRCGDNAPRVADPRAVKKFHHKRIAVHGDLGYVEWSMWGWRTFIQGHLESGTHDYYEEDLLGQAALTNALVEWVTDVRDEHPLNLAQALVEFDLVLAIYMSALDRTHLSVPVRPRPALMAELRSALAR